MKYRLWSKVYSENFWVENLKSELFTSSYFPNLLVRLFDSSFDRFLRLLSQYSILHCFIMDEMYEFFKNFFPAGILLTFPIVFLIVPIQYSSASNEFSVYRMQQFNFYGVSHGKKTSAISLNPCCQEYSTYCFSGCRSSSFSLEAKSLKTWKTPRHCVITRLKDLTNYKFLDIAQQAGALLVMLPKDITSLSADEKAVCLIIEY